VLDVGRKGKVSDVNNILIGKRKRLERRKRGAAAPRTKGRKPEPQFRDFVESALEAKRLRGNQPSSIATERSRLRRVLPAIGHLKARQLTAGRIERFLQDLARGDASHDPVKGATVNRFHSLLSSILQHAVRQGLTAHNPLAGGSVPWSKESKIHVRYLAADEQRHIVAAIRRDCPRKVLELGLAILTGMRRGEQFNARWSDWKRKEGVLEVTGKTGPRKVRINRAAHRCLLRLRRRASKNQVFITPERNEMTRDRRVWFERAVRTANLQTAFRYHDLRHTFCSRLVAAGVPLLDVKELAGHKSYSTTLRYAHLSPDHLKRAVEKVAF
jgi:site-specific recombinase XerD